MEDKEITFEIVKRLGALGAASGKGWAKELNLVSWNGRDARLDIREWSPDHLKMGKGVTLSREEATALRNLLGQALS